MYCWCIVVFCGLLLCLFGFVNSVVYYMCFVCCVTLCTLCSGRFGCLDLM